MLYRSAQLPQLPDGTFIATLWHGRSDSERTLSRAILIVLEAKIAKWELTIWVDNIEPELIEKPQN